MKRAALITGATSGIGLELAKLHASNHGNLILIGRNNDKLLSLASEIHKQYNISTYILCEDLSKIGAAQRIYEYVESNNIKVEYLINNAGFGGIDEFYKQDINLMQEMINVNITTLTCLTRLFLPHMVENQHGRILNISSIASIMPGPLQAIYYASKSYVSSLTNALSEELKGTGVSITNIMPGPTKSNFGARSGMDKTIIFKRTATCKEVAAKAYESMLKGRRNSYAGVGLLEKIVLRSVPLLPKSLVLRVTKRLQVKVKD